MRKCENCNKQISLHRHPRTIFCDAKCRRVNYEKIRRFTALKRISAVLEEVYQGKKTTEAKMAKPRRDLPRQELMDVQLTLLSALDRYQTFHEGKSLETPDWLINKLHAAAKATLHALEEELEKGRE